MPEGYYRQGKKAKPSPKPKPKRKAGGQLVPSTKHPFDIVPPTRLQKAGRRSVAQSYREKHGHVAGGAYSQRTIDQLSRSPQGREHLKQRAYALARKPLNPGDIKAAAHQQRELTKIRMAGVGIPGINMPGSSIATRAVTDLIDTALGTPYGAYLAVRHPIGSAQALGHEFARYRHPIRAIQQHPGLALVDAFALGSAGAGAGARLGAIGGALSRGEIGAAGRALVRPPAPPLRKITSEGDTMLVEPSRNAAVRAFHKVRGEHVSERSFNRALETRRRTRENYARGPSLALAAKGKQLSAGQQLALRAEREQIHPEDMVRFYDERLKQPGIESGRTKRRILAEKKRWQDAAKYVEVRKGELEIKDPELAKFAALGEKVTGKRESILLQHGLKDAEQMRLRKEGPKQIVRAFLGSGLKHELGPARGFVSHKAEVKTALPGANRLSISGDIGAKLPSVGTGEFEGWNLLGAKVPKETTRITARQGLEAAKAQSWFETMRRLRAAGKPATDPAIQQAVRDGTLNKKYVALMPKRTLSKEARKALHDFRVGISSDAADVISQAHQHYVAKDAISVLNEAGVRFVPRSRAKTLRPELAGAPSQPWKRVVDTINQATTSAYLYLGSKYVVTNTPGQVWLTMTQSFLNPLNIKEAVTWHHRLAREHPEVFYGAKEAQGGGMARSLVERGVARNPIMRGSNVVSRLAGKVVDDPYRWNAFVYHARRRGFKEYDNFVAMLKADSGPLTHERDVITEAANRDMIDYERLNHTEKEIIRRLVLFYPWIKSSTLFAGRWVREHPVQASVQLHLGNAANERRREQIGEVPQYASSIFPFGQEFVPGLGDVPTIVDPNSAAIITQTPQIGQGIINTIQGRGGVQLGEMVSPIVSLIAAVARYDVNRGEALPGDLVQRMKDTAIGGVPLYSLYRVWQRKTPAQRIGYTTKSGQHKQYVYPRSSFEQFMRSIVMGGLFPTPLNVRSLHHSAEIEKGTSSRKTPPSGDWWPGGSSRSSSGSGGSGGDWWPSK